MDKAKTKTSRVIVNTFFVALFVIVLGLLGWLLSPFITPLIFGVLLALMFYPFHKKVLKAVGNRDALAAGIVCTLVVVLVVIPTGLFLGLLSAEAFDLYTDTRIKIESGYYEQLLEDNRPLIDQGLALAERFNININIEEQRDNLLSAAQTAGLYIYNQAGVVVSSIVKTLFYALVIIFVLYYLLKDHKAIADKLMDLSPLPDNIEIHLIKRITEVGKAVFFGNVITAIVQGILGGLSFVFFGLGGALFWGTMMGVASLIPAVGVFVIAIPASLIFFVQGRWGMGLGFLAYNLLFVGTIDNILKPKLIESRIQLHPILVFLGVLGGLLVFGPVGIIYGPLIVTIFVAFTHIYKDHFRDGHLPDAETDNTEEEKEITA